MAVENVGGFRVLSVKFREESTAHHHLFIKEHAVREKVPEKPADRTLFLLNVPPYCTKECLMHVFNPCGNVTSVFFHEKPTADIPPTDESLFFPKHERVKGFKVAYVVFEKASGLLAALELDAEIPLILSTDKFPLVTGVQKWCQEYNARIPNITAMEADINTFMEQSDIEVADKMKAEKEGLDPDDEGWIKVGRRGRNPGFARKESVTKKILEKEELKFKKKHLLNFYTFQIREGKMKNLMHLREKFADDKKRIIDLRKSRKFKPF